MFKTLDYGLRLKTEECEEEILPYLFQLGKMFSWYVYFFALLNLYNINELSLSKSSYLLIFELAVLDSFNY